MKLKPDCVRDILLAVEDSTDYYTPFLYVPEHEVHEKLQKYTHNEIAYHAHQCHLAGLIHGYDANLSAAFIRIEDLSPAGHEFLANTRKNSVWEKVKEIGDEIGSDSAKSLAEIAWQMVLQLIRSKFPIT